MKKTWILWFFTPLFAPGFGVALECPVDTLAPYTWGNNRADERINVSADTSEVSDILASFSGDVAASRGQEIFRANEIHYDRQHEVIHSPQLIYGNPEFAISAGESSYQMGNEQGVFQDLAYYLPKRQALGSAKTLKADRKKQTEALTEATYTTCPRLSPNWSIKARELELNHVTGVAKARHATFRVKDTPIFYLPYVSFPLNDERKTGFLVPEASLSENRGVDLTLPFYINIAANQDATLFPRLMSKRGFMLGGEYRYLLAKLSGTVSANYLPDDQKTNQKRWSFKSAHDYRPNDRIAISALLQRVSDDTYLNDFENTLDLTNESFLDSRLSGSYQFTPNYRFSGRVESYQVVNNAYTTADKPYDILPRLQGNGRWFVGDGWIFNADTELTNFDKADTISGVRVDQSLSAEYFYQNAFAFINPKLGYRFTYYNLRNESADQPTRITRSIPTFSLDSGLFFERQTSWFGRSATQTLEPRLFYLRTPYVNQSAIPDFDTAAIDISYDALFLTNRFNGKDRIGDANQLTTAISTAYLDNQSGRELARLSVGQIQYFQNRKVSLLDSVASASRSSVIGEGSLSLNSRLKLRGLIYHNVDTEQTEKSMLGLTYASGEGNVVSLSHLYDIDSYEQFDFSGAWRLSDQWRGFWRWNYSLQYKKPIDMLAGIEYADCCWAVRLLARQQRDNLGRELSDSTSEDLETTMYLEFVLRGLGNVGNDTTRLLQDVIPGYRKINYE
ncbi:LPS-assembly protein LptD [Ostreibacterium oceani]|nr:LPS-assembly protein LptD [Ostreibacterium oceani]